MAQEKAEQYMQGHSAKEARVYDINFRAHKPGISPEECTQVYDEWTTYDEDLDNYLHNGPDITAKAVGEFFKDNRATRLILDVACGTGLAGQRLRKMGFENLHGLDPSLGMLEIARSKKVYNKDFQCFLDHKRLPIDDDTYDCAVVCGGMGEGHIPVVGLRELARIVKPGGLVCIVMNETYLENVDAYRGHLERGMKDMEEEKLWTMLDRVIDPDYSFGDRGAVFKFVVC